MRTLFSRKPLRSLATRINLLVILATMASSILVSGISLQSLDAFFRGRVEEQFPEIAHRISSDLDHWFSLRTREIEVFASSTILVESTPRLGRHDRRGRRARDEAKQYLRYVLENFPYFDRLILSDPEGNELLEVGGEVWSSGEWSPDLAAVGRSTRMSEIQRLGERNMIVVSTPLGGELESLGQLHALIDLGELTPLLANSRFGDGVRVLLVGPDRRLLNSSEGITTRTKYVGPNESESADGQVAVIHYDEVLGTRVVSTQAQIPRLGWMLVVEQPYDEVFAPVVSSMKRAVALSFAIVLACCLGAMRLAGSVVRPLRDLADAARRLSQGEREVEIEESHSSEEIQLLTRTFNEMSHALGSFARELEANHQAIESANLELVAKNDELSGMNLMLEQLSITDGLTKLHNHRYFQDTMQKACKRSLRTSEPLSLLLIDIDLFKKWNDRLGHAGGDEILRRIAQLFNELVRETDLLARYGGEEFAVLATNTTLEGAERLAEKLREEVAACDFDLKIGDSDEHLSVSVGVALFQGDRKRLFAEADEALYRAKDGGRDCVVTFECRRTSGTGD